MSGPGDWTREGQDHRDEEHAAEQVQVRRNRRLGEEHYRHIVSLLVALLFVMAVVSTAVLIHFSDVNANQDHIDAVNCDRTNANRAVLHADGREHEHEPGKLLTLSDMEHLIPITDCVTGKPLPVSAQRAYVAALLIRSR